MREIEENGERKGEREKREREDKNIFVNLSCTHAVFLSTLLFFIVLRLYPIFSNDQFLRN